MKDDSLGDAPLSDKSLELSDRVFSYKQGTGSGRYFCWEKLYNNDGNGYMQLLSPVEDEVFRRACPVMEKWYQKGKVDADEMKDLYGSIDAYVTGMYKTLFGL